MRDGSASGTPADPGLAFVTASDCDWQDPAHAAGEISMLVEAFAPRASGSEVVLSSVEFPSVGPQIGGA